MRYIGTLIAVLIGLPILRYSYATTWRPPLDMVEWLVFIGVLLATVFLVIGTHEVGHLVGGRIVGFRFRLLLVGPLRVVRQDGRIRLGWNRNPFRHAGAAGSAPDERIGSLSDDPKRMRGRLAIVLVTGPVASLVAGVATLALFLADVPDFLLRDRFAEFTATRALSLFAAGSLAVGVITLLPGGTRSRPTDGSRILELLRTGGDDGPAPPPAAGAG